MWSNLQIMFDVPVLTLGMVIDGLMIGGIFALIAYGLALVWGVMNVKNLAQGDFVILGAYITWWLNNHGIIPIFGISVAAACLWMLGWVVYKLVVCRVIEHDLFTSLLATFGVGLVLQ